MGKIVKYANLLASIEKGEEINITGYGEPVAKPVPFERHSAPRTPGSAKGKFTVSDDFFEPLPDEIFDSFEPATEWDKK